jgi:hypothetical protein
MKACKTGQNDEKWRIHANFEVVRGREFIGDCRLTIFDLEMCEKGCKFVPNSALSKRILIAPMWD